MEGNQTLLAKHYYYVTARDGGNNESTGSLAVSATPMDLTAPAILASLTGHSRGLCGKPGLGRQWGGGFGWLCRMAFPESHR
jgi:hypothetical protein